jgi:hypothetical protein
MHAQAHVGEVAGLYAFQLLTWSRLCWVLLVSAQDLLGRGGVAAGVATCLLSAGLNTKALTALLLWLMPPLLLLLLLLLL